MLYYNISSKCLKVRLHSTIYIYIYISGSYFFLSLLHPTYIHVRTSFLSALNQRNFEASLDHLHRYFDLNSQLLFVFSPFPPSRMDDFNALLNNISNSNNNNNNNNANNNNNNNPTQSEIAVATIQSELQRNLVSYSVLNLAILHFQFGHFREAIQVDLYEFKDISDEFDIRIPIPLLPFFLSFFLYPLVWWWIGNSRNGTDSPGEK